MLNARRIAAAFLLALASDSVRAEIPEQGFGPGLGGYVTCPEDIGEPATVGSPTARGRLIGFDQGLTADCNIIMPGSTSVKLLLHIDGTGQVGLESADVEGNLCTYNPPYYPDNVLALVQGTRFDAAFPMFGIYTDGFSPWCWVVTDEREAFVHRSNGSGGLGAILGFSVDVTVKLKGPK